MKYLLFLLCVGALLTGCAAKSQPGTYRRVDQDTAMDLMESEQDYIILDVRTYDEYDEGHIPGAICIPNQIIDEEPLPELEDMDQLILVYCRSGRRSKDAAEKLASIGYTNVVEFGGILSWNGEIES